MAEDVLAEIYEMVKAGVPLHVVRRRVGGDRVYLAVRPQLTAEQKAQIREEMQTMSADTVSKRHGISRTHAYRLKRSIKNGARRACKGKV